MHMLAEVASIIFQNLIGFDMLIFIVAAINLFCYLTARKLSMRLYKTLHLTIFLPEHVLQTPELKSSFQKVSEGELVSMRERTNSIYSIFVNLTGIFPLLGILGTVISLIPMVADISNMQANFFAALTSTFWGLIFAIIFKFLDGFLSPRVDDNNNNIALYLKRNNKRPEELPCETSTSS